MGRPRLKWGDVERYVLSKGYEIRCAGGEKLIIAPRDGTSRQRQQVRIGHTSCDSPRAELLKCYESKLRNVFGINLDEIAQ